MPRRFPKDSPAKLNCHEWITCMNQVQPTIIFASTIVWYILLDYCIKHGLRLPSSVRIVIAGGAPVPITLHRKLTQVSSGCATLYPTYGSTECLPIAYTSTRMLEQHSLLTDEEDDRESQVSGVCLGTVCSGIEVDLRPIELLNPNDATMPIRKIWLKGPAVSPKYEFNTTDSEEKKSQEWHDTGDLGYIDPSNQYLWFCGRMKHSFLLVVQPKTEETINYDEQQFLFVAPVCIEHFFMQHCSRWLRRCALVALNVSQLPPRYGMDQCTRAMLVLELYQQESLPNMKATMTTSDIEQELSHCLRMHGKQIAYYSPHITIGQNLLFTVCKDGVLPCDPRHNSKIERIKLKVEYDDYGLAEHSLST